MAALPSFATIALRWGRALALTGALLATAAVTCAAGFSDSLSTADQVAAGLNKLEPGQLARLNEQIEKELTLAREGNVRGFAGSFSRRRSEEERALAGLNLLTPVEQALIDAHVAQRMSRPAFMTWNPRSRSDGRVETVSQRPEIHGSVSLFYGVGGGTSYRGGAMTMTYDDPARNLSVSVTYSEVHGKGSGGRYVTRRTPSESR